MSTNDDSGSRRGRRPEPGEWRPDGRDTRDPRDGRWNGAPPRDRDHNERDQRADPAFGDRTRGPAPAVDGGRQNYSAFSRHPAQVRPEPLPPRQMDTGPRDVLPAPDPQLNYPEARGPSGDNRGHQDAGYQNFAPPLPAHERPVYTHPDHEEDLYGRRQREAGYDQDPYAAPQGAYRQPPRVDEVPYRQADAGSPLDDYDRSFASKVSQDPQGPRFFLPSDPEPVQRQGQTPPARDRGFQPQPYNDGPLPGAYAPEAYPARYEPQAERYTEGGAWDGSGFDAHDQPYGQDVRGGLPERAAQGDELDEDFFADEEDLDHEDEPARPRKRRTKLMAAALVVAIGAGGGTAYLYKKAGIASLGSDGSTAGSGTPLIRSDDTPAKQPPSNPGGRPFANGEKTIYDRLTPQGATGEPQSAALVSDASNAGGGAGGKLLEDALRRARQTADPQLPVSPSPVRAGSADQPTIVQGERYGPDGKRLISASISSPSSGLPPPFDRAVNATATGRPVVLADVAPPAPQFTPPSQDADTVPAAAARPRTAALSAPKPVPAAVSAAAAGFFVQIEATPDQSAATRSVQSLNDKYSAVLGDTQLTVKAVDKGDGGVWFREVAGPLQTRQAATDLCAKLKGAGLPKCIVASMK